MNTQLPLVIVGNGGAAAEAVLALRATGHRGEIHLFSENEHAPYNPTLGPYLVGGMLELSQVFPFGDKTSFYERNGVTAHLTEKVILLNPAEQTLVTSLGRSFGFQRCLVASGARPTVPPVPGLDQVFTLRTLADALALKETVTRVCAGRDPDESPRAAVIGASLAGVKVADVLHHLGFRVCLVEREAHLLPRCAHPECARLLEEHLAQRGYELLLGASLEAVNTDDSGEVRLDLGPPHCRTEVLDLAVVCTGSRPTLDFLVPGIVETDLGILVDEHLRSSHPALYAAGDVAQGLNLLSGRREIIGLWSSARRQGRAAGRNLAGNVFTYPGEVAHNITTVGGMVFASVGCMCDYDDIEVVRRRAEGSNLEIRLWKNNRLIGMNLLNSCLEIGILRQALLRVAAGLAKEVRATWMTFGV